MRIVGNAINIDAYSNNNHTEFQIAAILSGVGLSPLLLAMMGMLKRVSEGIVNGVPASFFNLLHIPIMLGLILAAVGSSKLYSTDVSKHHNGQTLARAGIVVLVVAFIGLVAVTVYTMIQLSKIKHGERRILYAAAASIPFIGVRLIYALLAYFDTSSKTFSLLGGSIWVSAFMSVMEEWITVILYLAAGLLAPVISRKEVQAPQMSWPMGRSGNQQGGYRLAQPQNV